MAKNLDPGAPAPEIALPDQDGKPRKLSDFRGRWVLVYFYPRDDTPGCTAEACGVRDAWSEFRARGVEVLGISADSPKKHRKFADKYGLPFPLLADEEKKVIRAYGAWGRKKFMGREFDGILRRSFLVDPAGHIATAYPNVKPVEHAREVLADVAALAGAGGASAPKRVRAAEGGGAAAAKKRAGGAAGAARAKRKAAAKGSAGRQATGRSGAARKAATARGAREGSRTRRG